MCSTNDYNDVLLPVIYILGTHIKKKFFNCLQVHIATTLTSKRLKWPRQLKGKLLSRDGKIVARLDHYSAVTLNGNVYQVTV